MPRTHPAFFSVGLLPSQGPADIDGQVIVSSFNKVAADAMSVLVVDDHASMRDMLVASLVRRRCRCEAASGGYEALEILSQRSFDIVLLDLWMEDLTGLEVLRQLRGLSRAVDQVGEPMRGHGPGFAQRVVMMSANADEEDRHEARILGVREFLDKPIEISDLWRALLTERNRDRSAEYGDDPVIRACASYV